MIFAWVRVTQPNSGPAPPQCDLVLVLVRHCELVLPSHPLFVRGEKTESTTDVVKDGVLGALCAEVVQIEETPKVGMISE